MGTSNRNLTRDIVDKCDRDKIDKDQDEEAGRKVGIGWRGNAKYGK
jgi:hypothetical protein